ncbi:o-succinylbenzoate synthase [Algoriphagus namhaensis]
MKNDQINFSYIKRTLVFTFDAGTSRGVLKTREVYWIKATRADGLTGWGEAAPLVQLSPDHIPNFESKLTHFLDLATRSEWNLEPEDIYEQVTSLVPFDFPSIRFALESALLDLFFGGQKKYFENSFFDQASPIPINGLIWMGEKDFMLRQIDQKLQEGFDCIKMKIGAIDFEQELQLLRYIRERFDSSEVTLRVDANGAFSPEEALGKLEQLARLDIHSIEQPIAAGQWGELKKLCEATPLPIALDEELIGIRDREALLDSIAPHYIILKPTLLGGIRATKLWIKHAESRGIGWWMTSALESNIGLNVIAQLTSTYAPDLPQGLGTGKLYHNNLASPLTISKGQIRYQKSNGWENPV